MGRDTISRQAMATIRPLVPLSFPLGKRWFVVYTNIRCENRAVMGLEAKGFDCFLPQITKEITHARRKVIVNRPLFPRYIFVAFDPERDEWFHPIQSTNGVERLIRNNDIPVRMPEAEIAKLRAAQDAGQFDLRDLRPDGVSFEPGELVRVSGGPFADLNAEVLAMLPDKQRVEVLLNLFGRATKAALEWAQVEKL